MRLQRVGVLTGLCSRCVSTRGDVGIVVVVVEEAERIFKGEFDPQSHRSDNREAEAGREFEGGRV